VQLRPYQQDAHDAVWRHLKRRTDNPCIVMPTGSGKTPLLAQITKTAVSNFKGRVLIVSHVKELLEQSAATLRSWFPDLDVGVYSAGLKSRDTEHDVIVCGIQSVYKRALEFDRRHLVIIDEAHLIQPDGDTMYRRFLKELAEVNPRLKILGLTATPYRTSSGRICRPGAILNKVCYQASIRELIDDGYLSPVTNQVGGVKVDTSKVRVERGDFVAGQLEELMDASAVVGPACDEIVSLTKDRNAVLVFCTGINHGEHVCSELNRRGLQSEFLCGATLPLQRASIIERFKSGRLKCLVNVNVLTTGVDATRVDCVAALRPTCSPGLFYQVVGRGFRLHDGKNDCLLLDYGSNLERHGALDDPEYGKRSVRSGRGGGDAPTKICPSCEEEVLIAAKECDCGFVFPESMMPKHDVEADKESEVLQKVDPPEWKEVVRIDWQEHTKRSAPIDAPKTLRVDYYTSDMGELDPPYSEWVCLEHNGFAFQKAANWWMCRCSAPVPNKVQVALDFWGMQAIADTRSILVGKDKSNPKYNRIYDYVLDTIPTPDEWIEPAVVDEWADEEIPF